MRKMEGDFNKVIWILGNIGKILFLFVFFIVMFIILV